MNRPFKFRVWAHDDFLAPDSFCIYPDDNGGMKVRTLDQYGTIGDCSDVTIQQFTGLQDIHGKDIYEGDILKFHEEIIAPVVWSKTSCAFVLDVSRRTNIDDKYGDYMFIHSDHLYEIVGNLQKTLKN